MIAVWWTIAGEDDRDWSVNGHQLIVWAVKNTDHCLLKAEGRRWEGSE
jgi:hypothetical protein